MKICLGFVRRIGDVSVAGYRFGRGASIYTNFHKVTYVLLDRITYVPFDRPLVWKRNSISCMFHCFALVARGKYVKKCGNDAQTEFEMAYFHFFIKMKII